jgi:hypothetical protein
VSTALTLLGGIVVMILGPILLRFALGSEYAGAVCCLPHSSNTGGAVLVAYYGSGTRIHGIGTAVE